MCIHTNTNTIYISGDVNLDPFDSSSRYYFLDSLVSLCLYMINKFEDHFDTRHGQNPR
jgi:hypothetical protein